MRSNQIRRLAMLLFVPAVFPAAALAQATRPADASIDQFTPERQQVAPERHESIRAEYTPEEFTPERQQVAPERHRVAPQRSGADKSLPQLAADYSRAVTALDQARQQRISALTELNLVRSRVRRDLLDSGDVEHARVAMDEARDQYLRARDQVTDRLQSDVTYVTDRKKAAEIDARLTSLRQHADVVNPQTTSLATQRLHYSAEADQLEQNALDRDAAYEQAREHYVAAVDQFRNASDRLQQQVEANPEVQDAVQSWQDARDDWQDARMRLAAAQAAYMTALSERQQDMHYLMTHGPAYPWYPYGAADGGVVIR